MDLSLVYFPSAVVLGALHALEPGHAKTLTAAYLIGTKGTKRDATILGLSVAFTHSLVVIGLSVFAVFLGREAFTNEASFYLAAGSSVLVIGLGTWLLSKRLKALRRARAFAREPKKAIEAAPLRSSAFSLNKKNGPPSENALDTISFKEHDPIQHDHSLMSDEEHARAHAADLPDYVHRGERPSFWQILSFGAAGGLVPCPAAVSVMLLSLSLGESGKGLIMVLGFSLGLAITLVGVGLIVVMGLTQLASTGKFSRFSALAPSIASGLVIFSGLFGLLTAFIGH